MAVSVLLLLLWPYLYFPSQNVMLSIAADVIIIININEYI